MTTTKKRASEGEGTFSIFLVRATRQIFMVNLMIYNSALAHTCTSNSKALSYIFSLTQLFVKQFYEGYHLFHNLVHYRVIGI
jgi:hypothetical protein